MRYGPCIARAIVTYSSSLSKNARIAKSFRGKVYIKPEAKAAELILQGELTKALKGVRMYVNKIYLDIHVYKPNNRVDGINFLDAIADVLKKVIKVDDRWFAVKTLDWSLDRENPRIVLKLYQPTRRNA